MKFNTLAHSVTAIGSIFAPLLTQELILPYIYHPYRLGRIPFKAPGMFEYVTVYLLAIVLIIGTCATIAGMMSTTKECHKISVWKSIIEAKWAMFFGIIGISVLFFLSVIKAPLLVLMAPVPYSNLLVTGIMLSMFVVFGHYLGTNYLLRDVCEVDLIPNQGKN